MAYSVGSVITATDYNSFATSVNTLWGTGSGQSGYGQSTTLPTVTASVTIASTEWSSAVARVNSLRFHQSGVGYTPTDGSPTSGGLIKHLSDFNSTLTTTQNNKLLAATNGTDTVATNYDNATGWTTSATRETSITFTSGNAARYFFNAGGKILVSYSLISPGTTKATNWQTLCSQVGTLIFGSSTLTRSGNSGAAPTINLSTSGYWNLTTSYADWFRQFNNSGAADYNNNYITFSVKSNGVQGANGDVGSVVTIKTVFTDAAADSFDDTVSGTLRMSVAIRPPESTYLTTNSWGTPTLAQVTNTQS